MALINCLSSSNLGRLNERHSFFSLVSLGSTRSSWADVKSCFDVFVPRNSSSRFGHIEGRSSRSKCLLLGSLKWVQLRLRWVSDAWIFPKRSCDESGLMQFKISSFFRQGKYTFWIGVVGSQTHLLPFNESRSIEGHEFKAAMLIACCLTYWLKSTERSWVPMLVKTTL